MGEAMIQGLLSRKTVKPNGIIASEPRKERREELKRKYGVKITSDNREAIKSCEVVVLALKPQDLDAAITELKGFLLPKQMVMSIVAVCASRR